jgi:hypothetical protein
MTRAGVALCWWGRRETVAPPVVVRIRDAILVFNVLQLEGYSELICHFAFIIVP